MPYLDSQVRERILQWHHHPHCACGSLRLRWHLPQVWQFHSAHADQRTVLDRTQGLLKARMTRLSAQQPVVSACPKSDGRSVRIHAEHSLKIEGSCVL